MNIEASIKIDNSIVIPTKYRRSNMKGKVVNSLFRPPEAASILPGKIPRGPIGHKSGALLPARKQN